MSSAGVDKGVADGNAHDNGDRTVRTAQRIRRADRGTWMRCRYSSRWIAERGDATTFQGADERGQLALTVTTPRPLSRLAT